MPNPPRLKQKAKKGKKQRKVGRNAKYCQYYALTHRREKSKVRKIKTHLKFHPTDRVAMKALDRYMAMI